MKLKLALATAILAVSTSAVQAADTRTPDILGSVSGESVQALSKADANKVRGEYFHYYDRITGDKIEDTTWSLDGATGVRWDLWHGRINVDKTVKRSRWIGGGYTVSR